MKNSDWKAVFKRMVEIVKADLRGYYRMVKKAKVVATYDADGTYWADVQPLRNDESVDENEPVVSRVEIPVLWAGPDRGVVCPPLVGAHCDLSYYDGDPSYPRISNFRWHGNGAPQCAVDGFIIQLEPGVSIEIDPSKNIIHLTSANHETEVGGDQTAAVTGSCQVTAGENHGTEAGGNWTVVAGSMATIEAPIIKLNDGTGVVTGECICHLTGQPHADVSTRVFAGKV